MTKEYFNSFTAKSFRIINEKKVNVSIGLSFIVKTEHELRELKHVFERLKEKYEETFYFFFTNSKDSEENY